MLIAAELLPTVAAAQLNTQHVKGASGLKAGSQPPPGGYVIAPLLYIYDTDTVKDADGNPLDIDATLTSALFAAGYSQVTTKKILGGFYGFSVLFPAGANNRIQGTEINQNPGAGLTDSVVTPITLGWHTPRADAMAGFTVYVPTGRYADGARNNTGFGMWGFEPSLGTTIYLDPKRQYHAATVVSFDVQSSKKDSTTKVGNEINFEGGLGSDFMNGKLTTGLAYYWAIKMSDDQIQGVPPFLLRGKNTTFGLGPEATFPIEKNRTIYAFVTARVFWETYARVTTQGNSFLISVTFPTKPIKLPG
ncbi:MAG TPA: transporter [Vicinamibacterales bacterium]